MSDQTLQDPEVDELEARIAAQRARQRERTSTPKNDGGANSTARLATVWQRRMRWLHVYSSMIAFVLIAFFGTTGLLLNHPEWLGGDELVTEVFEGTLPDEVVNDDGDIEFLAVSEFFRSEHDVVGEVTNFDQIDDEGSINYTGPAYGASARFDASTLEYSVRITEENFVNAMRDLHSGSDTNSAWDWTIDISAGFLLFVSVTGLGIQLLMKKRRRRAVLWLAGGAVVSVVLVYFTLA